jgi:hypothetical protein
MHLESPPKESRRAFGTWLSTPLGRLLLIVGVLLVVAALVVPTVAFVRIMSPSEQPAANETRLGDTQIGGSIEAVVRLDRQDGDAAFSATFLEPLSSNRYRVTSRQLRIELAGDVTVAMGSAGSLRPGAVALVGGTLTSSGTVIIHRATVLTGFVTVAS